MGLIFNQSSTERDYIVDNEEIRLMCQMQDEIGEHCVTAVFSQEEHEGKVCALTVMPSATGLYLYC